MPGGGGCGQKSRVEFGLAGLLKQQGDVQNGNIRVGGGQKGGAVGSDKGVNHGFDAGQQVGIGGDGGLQCFT
jgi:hypothetical protein